MHAMTRFHLVVLGLVVVLLVTPLAVRAQGATPAASPAAAGAVLSPDAVVAGATLGEWHARWFQWSISLFVPGVDPNTDATGERCALGQHGPVFFLAQAGHVGPTNRTCTVPSGAVLFVPIFNVECSSAEDPPYHGETEAQLRQCAAAHIDIGLDQDLPTAGLAVDGQAVTDLSGYRAPTPLFTWNMPPKNSPGAPAGVASSVGDGYAALIGPLSDGAHVVEFSVPNGTGGVAHITYRLTVAAGPATN